MSTSSKTFRTHPLNVSYLVVGLIFLGLAGSWALREVGVIDLAEVRWLFPLTLVVAGVIGIVAMTAKGLSTREDDGGPVDPFVTQVGGPRSDTAVPDYTSPDYTSPDYNPDHDNREGDPR